MVRRNSRTSAVLVFALISFAAAKAQAQDEMELHVRRTGPVVKTTPKARPTEIIVLRGEARLQKKEERERRLNRGPDSVASVESRPIPAGKSSVRVKPVGPKSPTAAKATLASNP